MTTTTLNAGTDAYVLSTKASTPLGGPAQLAIDSGQAYPLIQFPLGTRIPVGATVTEARLRVYQVNSWTGATTLTARRVSSWKAGKVTWTLAQALTLLGADRTVTQSDTANNAAWTFIVTSDVQAWLGGAANYGWRIQSSSTARRYLRGFDSSKFKPVLEIDWTIAPAAPTDLKPSFGAVSTTKPLLTFSATGITSLQVQIDPTGVFTSPTFDSGQVSATVPQFDLATSSYGGLTSGSTMWRARVWNASGVSAWSQIAGFSYASLPSLVITNPGSTTSDATPPVMWTLTGQTERRVITRDATGTVLDDTEWDTTTAQVYTPLKGVTVSGQVASVEVQGRDNVVREANANGADYSSAVRAYTFNFSATPLPVTSLSVTQTVSPFPILTWTRAEIPDGWAIVRDDEIVASFDGVDAQTATGFYEWKDWTANPNRQHVYFVAPIVNGETGSVGPHFTITPRTLPLWLADPATGAEVCIWGDATPEWDSPEDATVYVPLNAEYAIRRVTGRLKPVGSLSGLLVNVPGYPTALECEALLEDMIEDSATGTFRMVAGPRNIKVTLGNINLEPSPLDSADDPVIPVSWSFWSAP